MSWHGPSAPRVDGMATKSRGRGELAIKGGIDGIENALVVSFVIMLSGVPLAGEPTKPQFGRDRRFFAPLSESQRPPYSCRMTAQRALESDEWPIIEMSSI